MQIACGGIFTQKIRRDGIVDVCFNRLGPQEAFSETVRPGIG